MPQKRSDMRRVKEVLRLAHELGYSLRQVAESVRLGRTSVRDYLARADAAGVRYEDVADKGEAEIEALLFRRPEPAVTRPQPDWAELAKPAVSLLLVCQEYRERHPDGYSYSHYVAARFMWRRQGKDRFPWHEPQHKFERRPGRL